MRSYPIVFPSPLFYQDLSLRQCGEYLTVEQLVSQLPVKRFDVLLSVARGKYLRKFLPCGGYLLS